MKWLVFLLVLANLLFFAYSEGYFGRTPNPDAIRLKKQVKPENVRIVSRGVPPLAGTPTVQNEETKADNAVQVDPKANDKGENKAEAKEVVSASPPPAETCLAWQGLASKDAERLAALLTEKFSDFKQSRRIESGQGKSWRVFIPPFPNRADAEKKAGELKQLGVKEFAVVQDAGPKYLAISFGHYPTEAAAKSRLSQLRDKGVRSAKLETESKESIAVEARGPAARRDAVLETTQSVSSVKLEAKACQ